MRANDARLLFGAGVVLLAISLINGFLIGSLPLVRLALSAHLVGLIGSAFLIGLSASWPLLALTARASRIGSRSAVYGFCVGWVVYFIGAATGAGGMFPMASGNTRGSLVLEGALSIVLLSVAIALFALCAIVLKGVRDAGRQAIDS